MLGSPLTHPDWMLRPGVEWGEAGVRHMLDACKAAGWSRIYWRVLDGGRALYKSDRVRAQGKWELDNHLNPQTQADKDLTLRLGMVSPDSAAILRKVESLDYASFDSLAAAVKYGHEIGLQIHAWVPINEDDHGWGVTSDFAKLHPALRWVRRDGRPYRSQVSFAFSRVRDYKLGIIKELIDGYAIDGLFLDWIRTGDVRDNPQNDDKGIANYGYEKPNIEAYKKKFGKNPHEVSVDDPDWMCVRAEPQTVFMRSVNDLLRSVAPRKLPLSVLVNHNWSYRGLQNPIDGNLKGMLLDVAAWAREGLIGSAVAAGYYRDGGTPEKAYQALRDETGGKIDVWLFGWVPNTVDEFTRDAALAHQLGAPQLLLWEADYIDGRPNAPELKAVMNAEANAAKT